ncbi:hypothetical protein YC2023_065542 [Brassica napus]
METTRLWNENLRNKKKFETHVNYSKYTILDPKVCRFCLRNLTDRSLILKGSTNHSRDEVSQFADQSSQGIFRFRSSLHLKYKSGQHMFAALGRPVQVVAVPTSKGQALADEYGSKFFETSAKTNLNVEEVFFSIAKDIKQRLTDTDSRPEWMSIKLAGKFDFILANLKVSPNVLGTACSDGM